MPRSEPPVPENQDFLWRGLGGKIAMDRFIVFPLSFFCLFRFGRIQGFTEEIGRKKEFSQSTCFERYGGFLEENFHPLFHF